MPKTAAIYVWRKLVTPTWLEANGAQLDRLTGGGFAEIERPGRKRILIEVAAENVRPLQQNFGGRSEKLGRDWLNEMLRTKRTRPIRVGQRLTITSDERHVGSETLVIPAGAAFGTGEHATTAMSLRLLERVTRRLTRGWRMLDAGTGSGILSLAGRKFWAREVIAVENNPLALSVAKENARMNRIRGIEFIEADVADCMMGKFDIITANLYAELLLKVLLRFRRALKADGKLILSGVMRAQESKLLRQMKANQLELAEIRRRGKWIALLAQKRG